MILGDRSMLYRMGLCSVHRCLCSKLCNQKWRKSNAFDLAFIFISNGPVSEKRDFLEKLKGSVSRVCSFHATYNVNKVSLFYHSKFKLFLVFSFWDILWQIRSKEKERRWGWWSSLTLLVHAQFLFTFLRLW